MRLGPIPPNVREEMYELCGGLCEYCKSSELEINPHHKPFRSQPGSANDSEHLVWLCRKCHKMAHQQHIGIDPFYYQEFREWYDTLDLKELRGIHD